MRIRPITFRKITAGHYRNEETGVEITKVPAKRLGRNGHRVAGWSVTAPWHASNGSIGRSEVGFETTLKAAKEGPAARVAQSTREGIAADYDQAQKDFTAAEIGKLSDAIENSPSADVARPGGYAKTYRQTAREQWYAGDYDRARAWVKEGLRVVAEAADGRYDEGGSQYDADYAEALGDQAARDILPVATGQPDQVREWMRRHGLTELPSLTAQDILAARDDDHAHAVSLNNRMPREEETRRSPNRQRYVHLAHAEALKLANQPLAADPQGDPPGDECRAPVGHLACARPNGHRDEIGHAWVRYPAGTPEYAEYQEELRARLQEWAQR